MRTFQHSIKSLVLLIAMIFTLPLYSAGSAGSGTQTIYEDAESGATANWKIYVNESGSAEITNVEDVAKSSRVITFTGDGLNDGYRLGGSNRDANRWNNTTEKNIRWSMNYAEDVSVYVLLQTAHGTRYLKYTNSDADNGVDRGHIHHGLGSDITDGTWRTFDRDLEADLQEFNSTNSIIAVNAFLIRGSGSVDDIKLYSSTGVVVVGNQAPLANAGLDNAVDESTQVSLDASGSSDADGDSLTYLWTMVSHPSGSNAVLSDATVVNPSFVADEIGDYVFNLVVNDGQVDSSIDTVTISANLIRNKTLSICDIWSVSNSGGVAGTFDRWDISQIPEGATFDFEFEAYSVPDKFKVTYPVGIVQLDSGWRGYYIPSTGEALSGPGTLNSHNLFVKGASNTMTVQASGEQRGTAWTYRVRCVEHSNDQ